MKIAFFAGEIYNKTDFGATATDSEVVLSLFRSYGVDAFAKLRGAFAFAVEDDTRIYLVSDHFATIPFYYCVKNGVKCSTQVLELLRQGVPRKLSKPGLATYLSYGSVHHPWTLIEGVYSVPPASYIEVKKSDWSVKTVRYWMPSFETRKWDPNELNEAITERLMESVRRQIVYGGNPCAFLSGGIDSSAIVAMMRRIGVSDIRTYCVVNEACDARFDERKWARMVADRNGTTHQELVLTNSMFRENIERAVASYDMPSFDGINFWFGVKLVKDAGERVVFSGEGGDELFLGKSQMIKPLLACKYAPYFKWVPRSIGGLVERFAPQERFRKLGQLMGCNVDPFHIAWRVYSEDRIAAMLKPEVVDFSALRNPVDDLDGRSKELDLLNYVSWMDFRNIEIDSYLRDGYQTSLPHGVGVRTPILDVDLVEILYSIPGKEKYDPKIPKPHLIKAAGDGIPVECTTRKKMGFSLPFDYYLKGAIKDKMEAFLLAGDTCLFDDAVLRVLGRQYYSGKVYWSNVWIPFMVEDWCKRNKIEV